MKKECLKCKKLFKTYAKKRKFCSQVCWYKSSIHINNLGKYKNGDFIANRNKEVWFRNKVSDGLKRYFEKNPRNKENWYIQRYGNNYKVSKCKHSNVWKTLSVKLRKENNCLRCDSNERLEVHHIIPYSISKNNSLKNLVVLCKFCHKLIEDNNIKIKNLIKDWEITRLLFKYGYEDYKNYSS